MFAIPRHLKTLAAAAALSTISIVGTGIVSTPVVLAQEPALSKNINDYVAAKIADVSATMKAVFYEQHAGEKINKDFGLIYKVKGDVQLRYKEENKLRVDGYVGASVATLINNGTKQYILYPAFGLRQKMDLGNSPGKRKTLLDVGMISEGYLAYTTAEFKHTQVVDDVVCAVFRVSYRDKSLDTSHRMVWIDPKTKVVLKREEYSQTGKLLATYLYKNPIQVQPGVWFPSSIEVYNNEGEKAGVTSYNNVKVNQGLDDSVFQLQ